MIKKYFLVFLISMIPLIELRGSVPIGLSNLWGGPIDILPLYLICIIGNMLPVPVIFFFARKVLVWGADKKFIGKFFKFCLEKGEKGGKKLQEKAGRGLYWALFIFVGIPLPGTGAWTGTLAASLLDMDFKKSSIAVMAILSMYSNRGNLKKQIISMSFWIIIYAVISYLFVSKTYGLITLAVILAYPLLNFYNGEKGKLNWIKWFFYLYYPLHLVIIGILRITIYGNIPILFN